ncbi:hypothetical protein AKJ09_10742 [Labilithrix luteola]|uniref:Uncharacterized protein n=1 Tax=Labilithrix luteola TaxID=1391654 RepID=A0A0K1QE90_9BACT|nr:hypothetical protein AKJ09_10742 [Labilithrix luteola]
MQARCSTRAVQPVSARRTTDVGVSGIGRENSADSNQRDDDRTNGSAH